MLTEGAVMPHLHVEVTEDSISKQAQIVTELPGVLGIDCGISAIGSLIISNQSFFDWNTFVRGHFSYIKMLFYIKKGEDYNCFTELYCIIIHCKFILLNYEPFTEGLERRLDLTFAYSQSAIWNSLLINKIYHSKGNLILGILPSNKPLASHPFI